MSDFDLDKAKRRTLNAISCLQEGLSRLESAQKINDGSFQGAVSDFKSALDDMDALLRDIKNG